MIEWLVVVLGAGVVITTWLMARARNARADIDIRKRAASLGPSKLGRRLFGSSRHATKKSGAA